VKSAGLRPLRAAVADWTPGRSIASDPLHAIAANWAAIVGADVATHSAPLEISGKTLVVATKSSAWSQQLQFLGDPILDGVRAAAAGAGIDRIAFRAGALRPRDTARGGSLPQPRRRTVASAKAPSEPAPDLQTAFERFRDRVRAVQRASGAGCPDCGAPDGERSPRLCAPCTGRAAAERALALEQTLYAAPWLALAELRAQIPDLSGSEFERARQRLLQRWWLILERARRSGRLSASGIELHIASSYVLLQSRLPPDRISPAVIRNLLGDELEALLWPSAASGVGPQRANVEER
jgi:hypothetical protein